jgi:23S rRNA (cytosine1962-C5)-methyltransferase
LDERGKFLAWGTYSAKSHVAFRVLTLQDEPVDKDFFANRLQKALEQRKHLLEITNAVRLVHAEADFLPGLIVDRYGEFAVIQVRTKGMERLRNLWFEPLMELLKPKGVYERSDMEGRKEEGLTPFKGLLYGTVPEKIEIVEHGLRFLVDVERGLKTGFYLDQRDNRKLVGELVQPGEQFLDLFAYTGAFSIYAATKGAECTAVEQHKHLVELGQEQAKLNGVKVNFRCGNVFEELPKLASEGQQFDFIVIDPPAIAKSEKQIASLRKAIHRVVSDSLRILKPGGRMLVCTLRLSHGLVGFDRNRSVCRFGFEHPASHPRPDNPSHRPSHQAAHSRKPIPSLPPFATRLVTINALSKPLNHALRFTPHSPYRHSSMPTENP